MSDTQRVMMTAFCDELQKIAMIKLPGAPDGASVVGGIINKIPKRALGFGLPAAIATAGLMTGGANAIANSGYRKPPTWNPEDFPIIGENLA